MGSNDISALERKVDELLELCGRLAQENKMLRANAAAWKTERTELIRKNDVARSKVEAMITRLKALEHDS